ncbi:MAG: cytochrome c3 family protein, partial [Bacteroidota bacterium]|nr:cytochrome c3 family protein [Bacteroidota bacterium]
FTFSLNIFAQTDGAQIFKANCVSCHTIGGGRLIGPDLEGITKKRKADWLKQWINSSSDFIASGDADAIAIFEEYNKVAMTSFYFEDEDMDALLAYLENPPIEEKELAATATTEHEKGMINSSILLLIAAFLFLLVYVLTSIKNKLKTQLNQPTESLSESVINQGKVFLSESRNIVILGFVVFIVVMKFTFNTLMGIGVTTNYQPEQPIAFSHKIHAGDNGIDCNYCHSSARNSKTAGIPSANACMNCHANITSGTNTGTTEIQKIYDAIGYNPDTREYIEGYEQKPIQWVRIHNLPDLTYFNHSQHVSAGGVECQECHGPVQEMDVVYQHSELTMGWCINCHRETQVKMEGNDYYTKMHEKMKEKYAGQKITVDKMGGLECGKCHY